ncbi:MULTISPECIES: helix-turn-helix domain-containing protein [unclassified Dehalobacter]|uniref:helix-turn-helix domain-containing protein n=1 Tax=unclassified Dehalobacter TaxID=2635733 RepID=UPI000E6C415E|nr:MULTISPECIES: helix-turn-helix domain-containing protein [unclassified Dehalobacter]RJE46658.1 transcriptional regulator [Dehalobacter sp. MCB1]TCX47424.1 transcriptional regulator [Dehalobacter sp. 14DCB1]TCX55637.1 transcriptional regulator [Dehalobacter sp. 12DCB1]
MPIAVKLESLLSQKNIPFSVFAEKAGVTKYNLSTLKSNRAKLIRFSSLDRICKTLNCQPGDILEYIPDEEKVEVSEKNRSKEV